MKSFKEYINEKSLEGIIKTLNKNGIYGLDLGSNPKSQREGFEYLPNEVLGKQTIISSYQRWEIDDVVKDILKTLKGSKVTKTGKVSEYSSSEQPSEKDDEYFFLSCKISEIETIFIQKVSMTHGTYIITQFVVK